MVTLRHIATLLAPCHRGITATIEKKYRLHPPTQGLTHIRTEFVGKYTFDLSLLSRFGHVDNFHLRQFTSFVTMGQLHQSVTACTSLPVGLHSGRRTAKQCLGPMHASQHYRCVAGIVARSRILLLVGRLMLFVDNDESQRRKGQKHRRARTDNDLGRGVVKQTVPYLHTLVIGKFGVIYQHVVAKHSL